VSDNKVFCPNCGHPNPVGSRFCASCAAALPARAAAPQPPPAAAYPAQPPRRRGFPWLTCAIVAAILLCLCAAVAVVGWFYGDQVVQWLQTQGITPPGSTNPGTTSVAGEGSLTVKSGQEGIVTTPGGARLEIPAGAVPPTDAGEQGAMVFSIQAEPDQAMELPGDLNGLGPVYRLGPEGFTFALPVKLTMPIPEGVDPSSVTGATFYDVVDGTWKLMPAAVDVEARAVSVDTTHFSLWGLWGPSNSADSWRSQNGGWIEVNNGYRRGSTYPGGRSLPASSWYGVCIQSWTADDPAVARSWTPPFQWKITVHDQGTQRFWMPAGQYTLVEFFGQSEINNSPMYIPEYYTIWRPVGTYGLAPGQTIEFQAPSDTSDPEFSRGSPPCWGEVTTSVGTGDVQVTLTWHAEADIDLHVIDPSGDEVYYGNEIIPSGGELDRDNFCSNFIMGRPENVFWPSGEAPSGSYTVKVHYFSDCNDAGAVEWTVRTVVMGQVNTYSGTLGGDGDEQVVTTFTVP